MECMISHKHSCFKEFPSDRLKQAHLVLTALSCNKEND